MPDSEPIQPSDSDAKTPLVSDGGSMSDTKNRTIIGDTKSRSESQSASQPDVVAVGTKLGPYELVRKLGQGGMGAVYEARHSKLNKTFALKVLPPGFASNEAAVTRFEREMQAIGQLDHPHIIKATDAGEWNGTHILVMEYVEGTDLSVLVKTRGPLSVRDACKVIRQAALGLQHAHEHGLVHRDIKPSNLFVTKSGQIKLLDLGLARLGNDGEHQRGLTVVGQILGTPDYMAPEQWDDTHSVDARADLYSLGCTLCFVLTGRAPYADVTKSSLLQLMKAHVEGAIPNLTDIRLDVPPELNAIFVRLLAKQVEDRYPNAAEVIAALEPFTRKGADGSTRTSKPVFAPGKEPPTAHAVPSTSDGQANRDGERSGQRSIKSLSASSTDDAFASDRSMIHGDSSTSFAETIIQLRAAKRLHRRWPLMIGLSVLSLTVLAGIIIKITKKDGTTLEVTVSDGTKKVEISESSSDPQAIVWHGWPADAPKPAIAPFGAQQAKKHQKEWAAYLKVPVDYTNTIGMKFRLIPPGEFMMGCPQEENEVAIASIPTNYKERFTTSVRSDPRLHRVIVTHPFYFGLNEVSQQDYLTVVGRNPSAFSTNGTPSESSAKVAGIDTSTFPVETVSWHDATVFAGIMSKSDGILELRVDHSDNGNFQRDRGYRLPTEAEYEYACRAGTQTQHWCDNRLNESAWWNGNSDARTHAVGTLAPNSFGLFDLEGNVWEWCFDAWSPDYYQQPRATPAINPIGAQPLTSQRVLRGGNYMDLSDNFCRAAGRLACLEDYRGGNIGFRLTLSVEGAKAAIAKTSGKSATTGTTP